MDNLKNFIENIAVLTTSGSIKWTYDQKYILNTDKHFMFKSTLSDKETDLMMSIDIEDDSSLKKCSCHLSIRNIHFRSGSITISSNEYPILKDINKFIYNTEMSNISNLRRDDVVLGKILNLPEMVQQNRDKILTELLNSSDEPTEVVKEVKEKKKKNILQRLFR